MRTISRTKRRRREENERPARDGEDGEAQAMGEKSREEHETESAPPQAGRRLNGSTPPSDLPQAAAQDADPPELQPDAPAAFAEPANEPDGSHGGVRNDSQGGSGAYWRANITIVLVLLAIWATVSFGFGIWLREPLDAFSIGGAPLGFWFAQQGAIYVFVVLIFVYVFLMERLDAKHHVEDESEMRRHHHTETSSS
ncbi:MAG: DUF4212 domain-containing protein [Maricaulaceae bacterium]